ncbi:replication termination factor 2 isoform X2 [Lycorma delicatula]|uniref:replication termination factor 2 isoform X2 n=1 Tax=Lycorma delicatula TaxID=130591 RepID=UPI003F5159D7
MGCDGGTIPKRDELVRTKKKPEQDVKDLQLTSNPAYEDGVEKGDGYVDRQSSPFICPLIGLEMNGKFKFCFLWTCGCVMSERALKEVKTKLCHKCQKPFTEEDVVVLNGNEEDLQLMMTKMESRQARLKAEKKAKKGIKTEPVEHSIDSLNQPSSSSLNSNVDIKKEQKSSSKLLKNGSGKRQISSYREIVDPELKKTKIDYSVAKDPNATAVYKSLFTSHKAAQQQTRAHWVTYNPFYN